jgi:hypothetical protein
MPDRNVHDTSGLTWAGQTYETDDLRPSGSVVQEEVNLDRDGLDVAATEVVMVIFQ